ncbi:MAG: LysM peptidoglycan-binding domain-containing protein [Caldilineaceae bacterium]
MNPKRVSFPRRSMLAIVMFWALVLPASLSVALAQSSSDQPTATPDSSAYSTYTVRAGEGWGIIAQRFGTTITELKRLNPQAVRYGDILHVGEQLQIPYQAPIPVATEYVVQPGDGWGVIAARFGVSMSALMNANPQYVRDGLILRTGDRLSIPAVGQAANLGSQNPAAQVTVETDTQTQSGVVTINPETPAPSTDTPTEVPTETATEAPTATDTPTSEPTATETAIPEATVAEAAPVTESTTISETSPITGASAISATGAISEAMPTSEPVAGCPVNFADYPEVIVAKVNEADGVAGLQSYLEGCGVMRPDSVVSEDWTGDGMPDIALLYQNPTPTSGITETELLVLDSISNTFTLGYQARPAGDVQLLATSDINQDGHPDIVWSDRNCGASTCFVTVNMRSWDGVAWQNWTTGNLTLPEATVSLEEKSDTGQGEEIILNGGLYGSVNAGPQRSRVETWGSVDGKPYTRLDVTYNASPCLYHAVLDANEAYAKAAENGYDEAQKLYEKAATDTTLKPCWTRDNEDAELRSFSLFRLALVAAKTDRAQEAADLVQSILDLYPSSPITPAISIWLNTLQTTGNVEGACAQANEYADKNPQVVDILANYGYANPSFSATDFCPVSAASTTAATSQSSTVTTTTSEAAATDPITATEAAASESSNAASTPVESATETISQTSPVSETSTVSETTTATSNCPSDLSGFAQALPDVLAIANGDRQSVLDYLTICKAANNTAGDVETGDFNSDGVEDVLVMPSIVADLGFGPNGTQGAVLVYHGVGDGSYSLAYNPEIYGGTNLLADEDLNGDGKIDLAWTVTGCTVSCVTETQVVTWDGEAKNYKSIIRPGALIAEGKVELAPIPPSDPGKGRQIVMSGGVSSLPDSGLPVPHTEVWESVNGAPFQRVQWSYDRKAEGNDCLRLRLVEADMALEAADVLSYTTAIDLYQSAINDAKLKACSIHQMDPITEVALLQGLGQFRLVEALALSGDSEGSQVALANLNESNANEDYKAIAATWLEHYQSDLNAATACNSILATLTAKQELWQVTDHYGINHPTLGSDRICFVPEW